MTTGTVPGVGARPARRRVVRSLLRAAGATAVLVVIYYLLRLHSASTPAAVTIMVIGLAALITLVVFAGPLDRRLAIITAKTEAARLVVTGQMIADLVILGIGIKVIGGAVRQRRQPPEQASSHGPANWSPTGALTQEASWLN